MYFLAGSDHQKATLDDSKAKLNTVHDRVLQRLAARQKVDKRLVSHSSPFSKLALLF